jgi:hypothetical protein
MGTTSHQNPLSGHAVIRDARAAVEILTLLSGGRHFTEAMIANALWREAGADQIKSTLARLVAQGRVFSLGYLPVVSTRERVKTALHYSLYDIAAGKSLTMVERAVGARGADATGMAVDAMCRSASREARFG